MPPSRRSPGSAGKTTRARPENGQLDGARGASEHATPAPSRKVKLAVSPGQWNGASPFPLIAEYAFLSDCHTGALVAPDGSVEWLCLPRFDAPSVFGALLDRSAGSFRLAPYGVDVPAGRRYEPGTNVLETTWMTPTGWVVVRDALTIGDWHGPLGQRNDPHAPADRSRRRAPARAHGRVRSGRGPGRARLRPALRLRRVSRPLERCER
jgi:hypothetical protein